LISTSFAALTKKFDTIPQMIYGVACFTLILVFIITLTQKGVPFSLAHWAYIFPLAAFSGASWNLHHYLK
jgi:tellurite resistance protein TehA-like permease